MELITSRLILRDHLTADRQDIHEYAKEAEFSKYDFGGPNTEEDTKNYIKTMILNKEKTCRYEFDFAVVDKISKKVIGGAGIRRQSEVSSVANMGWAINPNYQSKGLATEAAQALLKFGFESLELQVIWAICNVHNIASYKVMEKINMKKVGHLLKHKEFKGQWHDSFRYEVSFPEYLQFVGLKF